MELSQFNLYDTLQDEYFFATLGFHFLPFSNGNMPEHLICLCTMQIHFACLRFVVPAVDCIALVASC
jgi:hypothetical protein